MLPFSLYVLSSSVSGGGRGIRTVISGKLFQSSEFKNMIFVKAMFI